MDACMLVVTADRGFAELLRPQVENQGYAAPLADSYDEASLQLGRADAILLDLELPAGGVDTLRRLRIERPDLPIVAVATNRADAAAAADLGAELVLEEPFSIADVVTAVRGVVQGAVADIIDLRTAAADRGVELDPDDRPWFATR